MVLGLAAALSLGAADPPRAGPLLWYDDFQAGLVRWKFVIEGGTVAVRQGALVANLAEGQMAAALTTRPSGDFTVEMAGAQITGPLGMKYGLVLGWRDSAHYCAVLVNGNGYAEAYQIEDGQRRDWFQWQQWPHLLFGTDSNRVRADVHGRQITIRINDELLVRATADLPGEIGIWAQDSVAPSQVLFGWVQVWGK
jgi:hypothetical protein